MNYTLTNHQDFEDCFRELWENAVVEYDWLFIELNNDFPSPDYFRKYF